MANRLALAFALILMPTAAAAQLSDVVVVALNHKQYLDVPSLCCPPLAWATFGEGRWRLQVDYLRSYREDEGHGNTPSTMSTGGDPASSASISASSPNTMRTCWCRGGHWGARATAA